MEPRLKFREVDPDGFRAFIHLGQYVNSIGLEPSLIELVRLLVSQMNGCAYCMDAHTTNALALGETEQRLGVLSGWRLTPFYTDRERAALSWAEALTLISENIVPDDLYDSVRQHFTEKELVDLTLVIIDINGWDRFATALRLVPGSYNPQVVQRELEHR